MNEEKKHIKGESQIQKRSRKTISFGFLLFIASDSCFLFLDLEEHLSKPLCRAHPTWPTGKEVTCRNETQEQFEPF
jgi:hypothetical protein